MISGTRQSRSFPGLHQSRPPTFLPGVLPIPAPCATLMDRRGVAQPGSASALGAEGRRFESFRPDQTRPGGAERPLALAGRIRPGIRTFDRGWRAGRPSRRPSGGRAGGVPPQADGRAQPAPRGERSEPRFESFRPDQTRPGGAERPLALAGRIRPGIRTFDRGWRAGRPSRRPSGGRAGGVPPQADGRAQPAPRGERSEPRFESFRPDQTRPGGAERPLADAGRIRPGIRTFDRGWRAGRPSRRPSGGGPEACRRRRMAARSQPRGVSAANRGSNPFASTNKTNKLELGSSGPFLVWGFVQRRYSTGASELYHFPSRPGTAFKLQPPRIEPTFPSQRHQTSGASPKSCSPAQGMTRGSTLDSSIMVIVSA